MSPAFSFSAHCRRWLGNPLTRSRLNRNPAYSPTPSSSHIKPLQTPSDNGQSAYPGRGPIPHHSAHSDDMFLPSPYPGHLPPHLQNRVIIGPDGRHYTPSPHGTEHFGPSPFLPVEESPYGPDQHLPMPPFGDASPMMMPQQHLVSPTDHLDLSRHHPQLQRHNTMPMMSEHQHMMMQQQQVQQRRSQQAVQPIPRLAAPPRSQTLGVPRPGGMTRHHSFQPQRSASPHIITGDVFDPLPVGSPRRPASSLGLPMDQAMHMQPNLLEYMPASDLFTTMPQGISPARALGPAPIQPVRFSPRYADPMITPQTDKSGYAPHVHSSGTSTTVTTSSEATASSSMSSYQPTEKRESIDASSDIDSESPTRGPSTSRAMAKMQLNGEGKSSKALAATGSNASSGSGRTVKPPTTTKAAVVGGRTSAKFAKVAEDPGVEGIPPGPRPTERPSPSFACIIGQAILSAKAGGLSLEHIYRYVETAYPFFKTGDGAWRNSVRHNLSIHKMFETIPRTEHFPPGKGGIWVIHEDEKCHWPERDKFIKNFPVTHEHHSRCRQTLHERQKEQEAMDKAAREGRVYVPKKGKKGRKQPTGLGGAGRDDDDEGGESMSRSGSAAGDLYQPGVGLPMSRDPSSQGMYPPPPNMAHPGMPMLPPGVMVHPAFHHGFPPGVQIMPPQPHGHMPQIRMGHAEFEDDSDFAPVDEFLPISDITPPSSAGDSSYEHAIPQEPLRRTRSDKENAKPKRRLMEIPEDDEGIFSASPVAKPPSKRVRVAEPVPLAPLDALPQETASELDDDSFITPERPERPVPSTVTKIAQSSSASAFKTPALVNTSSSPTSSPMPPTVTKPIHHPSALQQAWTRDDIASPASSTSSPRSGPQPVLDAAFDFKPKHMGHGRHASIGNKQRASIIAASAMGDDDSSFAVPGGAPKTPLTRSSAFHKTPHAYRGSPILPPPSASRLMSTPSWELQGVLDRLEGGVGECFEYGWPTSPSSKLAAEAHAHAQGHGHGHSEGGAGRPSRLGHKRTGSTTDPAQYVLLMGSGGTTPKKNRAASGLGLGELNGSPKRREVSL